MKRLHFAPRWAAVAAVFSIAAAAALFVAPAAAAAVPAWPEATAARDQLTGGANTSRSATAALHSDQPASHGRLGRRLLFFGLSWSNLQGVPGKNKLFTFHFFQFFLASFV